MEQTEAQIREKLASVETVGPAFAARAIHIAQRGENSAAAAPDELRKITRRLNRKYGKNVPVDVVLAEMDSSHHSIRYGNTVPGWRWRTTPEFLAEIAEAARRRGMNQTQFIEYALRLAVAKRGDD